MHTAHLVITLIAISTNTFSGLAAVTRFRPVMKTLSPMATAGSRSRG